MTPPTTPATPTTLATIDVASLLSAEQVAARFGVVRQRVYTWINKGVAVRSGGGKGGWRQGRVRLACVQLPSRVMFREADVADFIRRLSEARCGVVDQGQDWGEQGRSGQHLRLVASEIGTYPEGRKRKAGGGAGVVDVVATESAPGSAGSGLPRTPGRRVG